MVFAKLNPGIRYVQGMNEILAPLFYVFKNDPDEENAVSIKCMSSLLLFLLYCRQSLSFILLSFADASIYPTILLFLFEL